MNKQHLFVIGDIPGFTPQVARLVSMMNYVRSTTISAIDDLTTRELDYLPDLESNSISSLLLHITAAEVGYQAATFYKRELTDEEKSEWEAALALGEKAKNTINGQGIDYYLNKMNLVRATTLKELAHRDDQWLEEQTTFGNEQAINNYFKWFHVLSHELNHRGQIRWLRRHAMNSRVGN